MIPTLRLGLGLRFPGPGPSLWTTTPIVDPAFSGAFAPTNLPGLLLWFDAADTSSITLSSGTSVAQWNDKSGNSRHAIQATGARQPTLETAAQNGNNLIAFTRTTVGAESMLGFPRVSLGATSTLVAVVREGTLGGSQLINVLGDSVNPVDFPLEWYLDGVIYVDSPTTDVNGDTHTSPPSGCHTLIIPTGRVLFDGVDISIATAAGTSGGFIDTIGNGDNNAHTQGEMAEVMAFNRVLTAPEIAQVQSYLKTKWGTP